jgi:5-methylcytosine-specific restriction enzyme subunit McrC
MESIRVYEYDIIDNLDIDEKIHAFLERDDNKQLFKIVSKDRKARLKATQFVGIVQIEDTLIEVLPKLNKNNDDRELALKNFLFMLNYSHKFHNLKTSDITNEKTKGSFLEVFIYLYAKNLFELLKINPNRYYVVVEEDSGFLKGSWRLSEQLSQAPHLKHRFFVSYDEFTDNNLLNQVFKYVAKMLIYKTKNQVNKKFLQNILLLLTEIDDIPRPSSPELEQIKFNRLNKEFEPVFNLAKMFLEKMISAGNNQKDKSYSFMFNMNDLFEEFIAEFIKQENILKEKEIEEDFKDSKIIVQARSQYLSNDPKVFQLKPDILISKGKENQLIIDTKYKLLEETEDKKQGVSEADAYQMYAYAKKYKCNRIILLYPQHLSESKTYNNYEFGDGIRLEIKTVNLQRDLENEKENLKKELIKILKTN